MKKAIKLFATITCVIIIAITAVACGNAGGDLYGTWKPESVESNGSSFTVEELEALGDHSISDMYFVFKEGGAGYAYADGSGSVIEWSRTAAGVKINKLDCNIQDGKIILENNGVKITLYKASDSQSITSDSDESSAAVKTTEEEETTEETTAKAETTTEAVTEMVTEKETSSDTKGGVASSSEEYSNLDLAGILDLMENKFETAIKQIEDGGQLILDNVGESYENYKNNVSAIEQYYADSQAQADTLYAEVQALCNEYYRQIAASKPEYNDWDKALDKLYDTWDDGMDDYYDAWDDMYDELYDQFDDIITFDNVPDYNEYSDAWSDMYELWSDTWSDMYEQWSDTWSDLYGQWSDLWSEFYGNNFDIEELLE